VLILVTIIFTNNYLNAQLAENEFSTMEQFMQTAGLQIDDVAWTIGRTETMRYAGRYGQISFDASLRNLTYVVYVNTTDTWVANFTTGILLFNMPMNKYNIANGYTQRLFPSSNTSFLQQGTTAPVSQVFVIERVPMTDGNFIRIVVAPSIRMLNSTITIGANTTSYYNCYLPILQNGTNLYLSQSVTLATTNTGVTTVPNINRIKINVVFPSSGLGFDSSFFNFDSTSKQVNVPAGSVLEFYNGTVTASLGLYS
jgi:hypothetical protein